MIRRFRTVLLSVALIGCASAPARFYTLSANLPPRGPGPPHRGGGTRLHTPALPLPE